MRVNKLSPHGVHQTYTCGCEIRITGTRVAALGVCFGLKASALRINGIQSTCIHTRYHVYRDLTWIRALKHVQITPRC